MQWSRPAFDALTTRALGEPGHAPDTWKPGAFWERSAAEAPTNKTWMCLVCRESYSEKAGLRAHSRSHLGVPGYAAWHVFQFADDAEAAHALAGPHALDDLPAPADEAHGIVRGTNRFFRKAKKQQYLHAFPAAIADDVREAFARLPRDERGDVNRAHDREDFDNAKPAKFFKFARAVALRAPHARLSGELTLPFASPDDAAAVASCAPPRPWIQRLPFAPWPQIRRTSASMYNTVCELEAVGQLVYGCDALLSRVALGNAPPALSLSLSWSSPVQQVVKLGAASCAVRTKSHIAVCSLEREWTCVSVAVDFIERVSHAAASLHNPGVLVLATRDVGAAAFEGDGRALVLDVGGPGGGFHRLPEAFQPWRVDWVLGRDQVVLGAELGALKCVDLRTGAVDASLAWRGGSWFTAVSAVEALPFAVAALLADGDAALFDLRRLDGALARKPVYGAHVAPTCLANAGAVVAAWSPASAQVHAMHLSELELPGRGTGFFARPLDWLMRPARVGTMPAGAELLCQQGVAVRGTGELVSVALAGGPAQQHGDVAVIRTGGVS